MSTENSILLNDIIYKLFNTRDQNQLELYITASCNQKCSYCYLYKHGNESAFFLLRIACLTVCVCIFFYRLFLTALYYVFFWRFFFTFCGNILFFVSRIYRLTAFNAKLCPVGQRMSAVPTILIH